MKDLVESQFIGSKNDIEELKKIIGTDCERVIASLLEKRSSLLNELILLKVDLNTTNEQLRKLQQDELPGQIQNAILQHERDMPHNQPAPTMSTENIDMNHLIDIVRHEANNIAQQAITVALNGLRLDISYNQPNQFGYYTQSSNTNSAV